MRSRTLSPLALLLALAAALAAAPSCATYDPPPKPTLDVTTDGLLTDPKAPILVHFSVPVDPATVRVKIARYSIDSDGRLPDERGTDSTPLETFFEREPDNGVGFEDAKGKSTFEVGNTVMRIVPSAALPVGPRLVLVFEPGLSDPEGHDTKVRKKLLFGYKLTLDCNQPVKNLASGDFFFIVGVKNPIATQIRMFATIDVDSTTGRFVGQFTDARRNKTPEHCPSDLSCKSTEACRTLPVHACVIPSEPAGSCDEYPDQLPDPSIDTGFSFTAQGCVVDQADGSAALVNAPVDVHVTSPLVTLRNTVLSAAFKADPAGAVRASGSLAAQEVFLGDISSGSGTGDLTALVIPPGKAPAVIPAPPTPPAK
jgi:hypothetical protein